ncbi:BTB domain-containing protein [Mycena indigotica]|uniref:BTB domain-containing protein n=1 Tax=Mycena indigotica TaxID=2126181 RepID=A0A8H6T4N4_9AGAR|nr:BTB domain-containing protein [Mycena indigotica]KAF7309355.1 BTB domain-containing protein [Mycena indigotica]
MAAIFSWKPFAYFALFFAFTLTPLVTIAGRRHRRLFFLSILLLTAKVQYDGELGYTTNTTWFACLLMASDFLLLADVQLERELHRPEEGSGRRWKQGTGFLDEKTLRQRFVWALDLLFTSGRGVGWAYQPRHLRPQLPDIPKSTFLIRRTLLLLFIFLTLDFANAHQHSNPVFCARLGLVNAGWLWRLTGTACWAALAMSVLSIPHLLLGIAAVGFDISRPRDWPPLFGRLEDLTSVRAFWARGWHQYLRRSLTAHGRYLANSVLKLPPRSLSTRCIVISTAFFLSGLVHQLGERVPLKRVGYGPGGGSLMFFSLQPLAIGSETLVSLYFQRTSLSPAWRRALGTAWVAAWFVLTLPIMQDPLLRTGEMDPKFHTSFVTWVLGTGWDLEHSRICLFE